MAEYNAKEIGLHIRRQREALGYSRERLAGLSKTSNPFPSNIEHGNRGFSAALLGGLSRVLGFSTSYMLFGTEQVAGVSIITDTPSGLDGKCLPELKEFLGAYLKTITVTERQDD